MLDQQLTERFEALRHGGQQIAPQVAPAVLRRRGHARRVRQAALTVAGTGVLTVGALVAAAGVLVEDSRPTVVPPAGTVTDAPAPSVTPSPVQTSEQSEPTPETSPTASPRTTDGAGVPLGYDIPANRKDFGYLNGATTKGGTTYLLLDRATLLTGEEARAAREAAGEYYEEGVDSLSTYVQNQNPRIRELPLREDAEITGSQILLGDAALGPAPVDSGVLLAYLAGDNPAILVELTYDESGLVDSVTEVYSP